MVKFNHGYMEDIKLELKSEEKKPKPENIAYQSNAITLGPTLPK